LRSDQWASIPLVGRSERSEGRPVISATWRSPGRVNLIGEHTDYNGGFALPLAISAGCTTRVVLRDEPVVRIRSAQRPHAAVVRLDELAPGSTPQWAGYAVGVAWALRQDGVPVPGLDIEVDGDVPLGAGLSSSAALSCSTSAALDDVLELHRGRPGWVALARRAENDFVGAATGGMDQLAAVYGRNGYALLCDMQTLTTSDIPFDLASHGLALLVLDTGAPHEHATGEYGARRDSCRLSAQLLGVENLRAVQGHRPDEVLHTLRRAATARGLDARFADVLVRRTRHVLTENARVLSVADKLRAGRIVDIGTDLLASHRSMRFDFEITVPAVDIAVESAVEAGALGARMTGGGFGGCVIALAHADAVAHVADRVCVAYRRAGRPEPRWFVATAAAGTRRA
jgi:galactokinase